MPPILRINLAAVEANARVIVDWFAAYGVEVYGVTKAALGNPRIGSAMLAGGCQGLADSRWENLRRLREAGITAPLMLIRTPALSEVEAVVRWADLSVNTEPVVLKALDQAAGKAHTRHRIILMVEAGISGRKGTGRALGPGGPVPVPSQFRVSRHRVQHGGLSTSGPSATSQGILQQAVALVEGRLEKKLAIVSGGNSGLLYRKAC